MDTKRSSISIGADMEVATVVVGGPLAAVATVAVGRTIETGSIGVAAFSNYRFGWSKEYHHNRIIQCRKSSRMFRR